MYQAKTIASKFAVILLMGIEAAFLLVVVSLAAIPLVDDIARDIMGDRISPPLSWKEFSWKGFFEFWGISAGFFVGGLLIILCGMLFYAALPRSWKHKLFLFCRQVGDVCIRLGVRLDSLASSSDEIRRRVERFTIDIILGKILPALLTGLVFAMGVQALFSKNWLVGFVAIAISLILLFIMLKGRAFADRLFHKGG